MSLDGKIVVDWAGDNAESSVGCGRHLIKMSLLRYLGDLADQDPQSLKTSRIYVMEQLTPVECHRSLRKLIEYSQECINQDLRKQYGLGK